MGRPVRQDFFGGKGVTREIITARVTPELANAIRDLCETRRPRKGEAKPTFSSIVEGLIWWGCYCAFHHRSEEETPTWTIAEAEQAGLTPLLGIKSKIGTVSKDGRFTPDRYSDPIRIQRKAKRRKAL